MRKNEERLEKKMADVMAANQNLVKPLEKAEREVEELRRQLANYDKDKQSLAVSALQSIYSTDMKFLIFRNGDALTL